MRSAAVNGARAWIAYAIAECWFASVLPWFLTPHYAYTPLHWGFTAFLFILYPAAGAVIGILCGFGVRMLAPRLLAFDLPATRLLPALTTLSVVVAFAGNLLVFRRVGLSELPPLLVAFLFALVLALSAASDLWERRLEFLAHPLVPAMTLLGLPWIIAQLVDSSMAVKALVSIAFLVLMCAVALVLYTAGDAVRRWRSTSAPLVAHRDSMVVLLLTASVILSVAAGIDQVPLRAAVEPPASPATGAANVILITMDTVRADHLSLYGYERDTTPNLQALSQSATLHRHAIATSDMTLATHASIFTGLYPRQHGAHYVVPGYPFGRPLDEKFVTLAEILAGRGYRTMAVVSNHGYLGDHYNLQKGFQYYDERVPVPVLGPTGPFFLRQTLRNVLATFVSRRESDLTNRSAEDINREVLHLLDEARDSRQRFFLFVNYMDAHWPFLPPPPFDTRYPGKDGPFPWPRYYAMKSEVMQHKRAVTDRERNHLVSQYDGGIAYLDEQLGKLIAQLKALELYDSSLIIITSDHGEAFSRRDLVGHGVSVYQDQIHIPLLIKYPNQNNSRVVDEVVSVIDLMPTILDVVGCESPPNLPGRSLAQPGAGLRRALVSETFPDGYLFDLDPRFRRIERAVLAWPFKFINSTSGKEELYDLAVDPSEEHDHLSSGASTARELGTTLAQWLASVPEYQQSRRDRGASLSENDREHLRALGYMH